ncbi:MAG: hypothetical protein K0U47_00525 [Epsilonproteobacteria bacterium]|nr:hypothetical protein [Campylobacterota bacterium]
MKTSKEIISHLINKPQHSQITQKQCIDKLISLLPPTLGRAIMFTYIKNRTLFFVLNHPGLKMEFNYKHNLIKSLLNKIKDIDLNCQKLEIDKINSFVSNKVTPKPTLYKKTDTLRYKERASGEFDNLASTDELKALFEQIKIEIKKNR